MVGRTGLRPVGAPAFTLLELITVAFLGMVVLYMIAGLLIPSLLLFQSGSSYSEAQQMAMLVTRRCTRLLLNTTLETVTVGEDRTSLAWIEKDPGLPFDPATGDPRLSDHFDILFYEPGSRRVLHKTWPGPGESAPSGYFSSEKPPRLSRDELQSITSSLNATEKVVARHVDRFEWSDADDEVTFLAPPLAFTVTCTVEARGGGRSKPETFTASGHVSPRSFRW